MMELQQLPAFVKHSTVLSDEEKLQLCGIEHLPSEADVDAIRHLPEIQELTNAFIGDDSTRDTHLQLKAREYLAAGDIAMAWKVILLD